MNKFLKEINEQPEVVETLLRFYGEREGEYLLEKVKARMGGNHDTQIVFTGMGSSFFIAQAASTLFNSLGFNSSAINASELIHYNLALLNRPVMLVCISQSGESFEIKEIFTRLTSKVFCIGIVNEEKSTLGLKSDIFLPARAGEEEMTSTKTYVATTLVSYILGWFLSGKWDEDKKLHVKHLSMSFQTYLEDYKTETERMLAFLGDIDTLQIIARGPSFSTACQSALMFKEALHIPATGILGGEFRHGPMEMVSGGFKAIVFSARGETYIQSNRMAADIARYGGRVLLITNEKPYEQEENIMKIFIDEPDEYLFSVGSILPVQLLVDLYAKTKGFEAGSFNRGSKVTRFE